MTTTVVSSASREVRIGFDERFCIIGERINPTGRRVLSEEMLVLRWSQKKLRTFLDDRFVLSNAFDVILTQDVLEKLRRMSKDSAPAWSGQLWFFDGAK